MSQHAIIYARFSTAEQSKGYSLERQQTLGGDFAKERGWQVEKTITDEGRSAFHGANRLEGSSLYEFEIEARNGLHDGKVLIVENIDRLSRQGAKAAAQLIWALNENGVSVATFHDGHVYGAGANSDMMDLFKLIILAQQSHEESANKSRRTASTWAKRFTAISDGTQVNPIPHLPHWMDRIDDEIVLNPARVAVLNEIYDLYIEGSGIQLIANRLNDRGEPTWMPAKHKRQNNGWFYGYIYRLLTKRAVLGEYVTREGVTLATDFFPQAITAEKWNRAQATLAMRKTNQKRSRNQNHNLLAQMVVCGSCGGGAHFEHTTNAVQRYTKVSGEVVNYRRKTYRRLRCDRARRHFECDNRTVLNYDVLEATILQELLPHLAEQRSRPDQTRALRERLAELIRLREAAERRLANLLDALADGPSRAILDRTKALEATIEGQNLEIGEAQQALGIETSQPTTSHDVEELRGLEAELQHEDENIRIPARGRANMALRRLIARIIINANGTWEVQPDDLSRWMFDGEGELLEGSYVP